MQSDEVKLTWSFEHGEAAEADETLRLLQAQGATALLEKKTGIVPIVPIAIAAVIGLSGLTSVIIRVMRSTRSGVWIDARGNQVTIRKDSNLPRGTVTAITRTGETLTVQDASEDTLGELIGAATGLGAT